ncbi:uncharacterized protein BN600_00821 [Roseburia sp. CAG:309]|nr:uncharacterized protein BN600_00821 [Roseburia sp. CAG:309]
MAAKANYSKKPANKKVVEEKKDVVKTEVKPVETKQEAVKEAAPAVTTAAPAAKTTKTAAKKTTKETAKKTTAKKSTAKKTGAKRGPKPASERTIEMTVQFGEKEVTYTDMVNRIKEMWKAQGKREVSMKSLELYVKPEESKVYYVINSQDKKPVTGDIDY